MQWIILNTGDFFPNKGNIVKCCGILNKRRWQTWPFTLGHKCNDNFSHKLRKANSTIQEIIRYPGEITEPNINRLFNSFPSKYPMVLKYLLL